MMALVYDATLVCQMSIDHYCVRRKAGRSFGNDDEAKILILKFSG